MKFIETNKIGVIQKGKYKNMPCIIIKETGYTKLSMKYSVVYVDNRIIKILNKFLVVL